MKKLLPALLFVVLLASARAVPAVLSARQARLPAGVTGELVAHAIESGGLERTYRVYCPTELAGGDSAPGTVCFHGGGGAAQSAIGNYGVVEEAEARGWIAVFPEGTGPLSGTGLFGLQTWNAGNCCGYAQQNDIDDVGFFEDLLLDLGQRYPVDIDRVCATGMSNGAMLTYRLACERPDLLAAVAPVAGSLESGPPMAPIPLLTIFGLLDQNVPFEGGVGSGPSGNSFNDQVSSLTPFLEINQARGIQLVFEDPTALAWLAPGAEGGANTAYYLALDGGHTWPGSGGSPINPSDPVHTTLPATPLMFDFFEVELGL
ncbi:MAG: CE1 family esterase [Planctomycetota bacterium]|jgi:polyhydroxybutyrate depolymerase